MEVDVFKDLVRTYCGAEYVSEVGLEEGSVVLYLQIPSYCDELFKPSNQEFHSWCAHYDVSEIWYQDEVIFQGPDSMKADSNKCKCLNSDRIIAQRNDSNALYCH